MHSPSLLGRTLDRLLQRLEATAALDRPAGLLVGQVARFLRRSQVDDALSGTWLGHPLHPVVVAVPIGAWTSALVLDLAGGDKTASRRLIGLGLLAALPTAASGAADWSYTEGAERRVGLVHAACNWSAIAVFGGSWLRRRRQPGERNLGLTVAGSALLAVGGYLGGHLTYAAGVGVDTTAFSTGPDRWTDVGADSDVTPQSLVSADLPGGSVLLTSHHGHVVAMDNRCTHRGGPLSEGSIHDGCVECPWHASRFDLDDVGVVRRGPATRSQSSYQVRAEGGRVQVRRHDERALRTRPVGSGPSA